MPVAFTVSWLVLAAGWAALGWLLIGVWQAKPEYQDRFLLPLIAVWLAWHVREAFLGRPRAPSWWSLLLVVPAALSFPVGWILATQVGPKVLLLWWLAGCLAVTTFGTLWLQFGFRPALVFAFPLTFVLLSLPWPTALQGPLQERLQELVTVSSAGLFPWLGVPVQRDGFLLTLPSGPLEVEEACSGIRSLAALTAGAALLAHLRGFGPVRGIVLLVLSLPVIVAANVLRILLTGLLQEHLGHAAIEGWAHEALSAMLLLVGLGLIAGVSEVLFRLKRFIDHVKAEEEAKAGGASALISPAVPKGAASTRPTGGWAAAPVLVLAAALCLWAERLRPETVAAAPLETIPKCLAEWTGEDVPISDKVRQILTFDQGWCRVYGNPFGRQIQVWTLFWVSSGDTVGPHSPDVCSKSVGWETVRRGTVHFRPTGSSVEIPASVRVQSRKGRLRVTVFWVQMGPHVLDDLEVGEYEPTQGRNSAYGWVWDRLMSRQGLSSTSTLFVMASTEVWGREEAAEEVLAEFCSALSARLYAVCPWAEPPPVRNH